MQDFKIPQQWIRCCVGDILENIKAGKSVKCNERTPRDNENGLVKISAVTWGEFDEDESKTLYSSDHLDSADKILSGDLLISRANTIELVGACVIVKSISKNLYLSDKVLRLELPSEMRPWLQTCLRSNSGRAQIESLATGNQLSMRNISQQALKDIVIPLPPLAEQKQIAAKLDELLAQVDTIKTRLDAIPHILKRFRQSVLTAAVSGRLTEEWRPSKDGIAGGDWLYEKAKDACIKVQSGSTPRDNPFDKNGEIPFLKVYNIVNQKIDFDYKPQYVTASVHNGPLNKSIAIPGDVLMNIVGPPLGKVAILTNQFPEWNLNQAITLFRPDPGRLLTSFLYYVLCEGKLVREVMPETKGSVGQVNISLSQCRDFIIPIPSIVEQTEIVRRVEQLFAYADQIEQRMKDAQSRVNHLTQSILAKAFRGELTADWRVQNPDLISGENSAEALLTRIRAEREASAAKPKTRQRKERA